MPSVQTPEASQSAVELLRSVPLFADLEADELERISRVAVPRSFPAGSRVFHEGDPSNACYIVQEGSFRVTREHSDGRAITLAKLGPGESSASWRCSTDGPFGQRRSAERRRAPRPSRGRRQGVARPPPGDGGEAGRSPDPAPTRANERISNQSFRTVPDGSPASSPGSGLGDAAAKAGRITIRMTQSDLAQLAGTSRESVSRFLANLERAGVVRSGRGRVTVVDPPKLGNYIFYPAPATPGPVIAGDFAAPARAMVERQLRRGGSPTSGCWKRWGGAARDLRAERVRAPGLRRRGPADRRERRSPSPGSSPRSARRSS